MAGASGTETVTSHAQYAPGCGGDFLTMATLPGRCLGKPGGAAPCAVLLCLLLAALPSAAEVPSHHPRAFGMRRRSRAAGGTGRQRQSAGMVPVRPDPDPKAPFLPADRYDREAWYPEFAKCQAASVPALEFPSGRGDQSPCVQLPLPPKAARFQQTEAKRDRPAVNVTQPGYLFVLGTPYGGTTAFLGLLSSSPHVAVPSAGWAHEMQWNLVGAKPAVYPFLRRSGVRNGAKVWKEYKEDPLVDPEDFDLRAHMFWDKDKPIKVDKSHNLVRFADKLYIHFRAKGSTVKFIILARHPCTYGAQLRTYVSLLPRVRRFRRVMEDHPEDSLLVFYEDFVTDPKGTAEKILRFYPELGSLDETKSQLAPKITTTSNGNNIDRGLATGGERQAIFKKKYVDDRMKRAGNMRKFSLSWCEGFPPAQKRMLPAEGLDLLRFYGWLP